MFQRTVDGLALKFHLAGINNQNFLMRDEQTGTYWQQITGLAVAGPLAGHRLKLVSADELTFGLWKREQPNGTVLNDAPGFSDKYAARNWDVAMAKVPTVISFPETGFQPRELMLGIRAFGASRAFPLGAVLKEKLIEDQVGGQPILLVVGPDNQSVRGFRRLVAGSTASEFYRMTDDGGIRLMDAETGSGWNFEGCAVDGKLAGVCLERVDMTKDYWFDWRNYNSRTTVYRSRGSVQ